MRVPRQQSGGVSVLDRARAVLAAVVFPFRLLLARKPPGEARLFRGGRAATMPYRVFAPEGQKKGEVYPLVLCLHGAAGRGTDNKVRGSLSYPVLTSRVSQVRHPAFVVAPQCPRGRMWVNHAWGGGTYDSKDVPISDEMTMALGIVDALVEEFPIDRSRLYVTGRSMGGFGTWDAIARRPRFFAAAVPIAGGGDPGCAEQWRDLPIWAVASSMDPVCQVSGTREVFDALGKAGAELAMYTEHSNLGHVQVCDAWRREEGLAEWLFSQRVAIDT